MDIKIIVYTVVILIILSAFSTIVSASDLNSLTQAIKDNQDLSGILNGEGKKTVQGLARDFFDVVRYIVISGIIIRMLWLWLDFRVAGEAIERKAAIKMKAIYYALGMIFSINFWTIVTFILDTIAKFKSKL